MRFASFLVASSAALLLTACGDDGGDGDGGGSPLDGLSGSEVADAAADALEQAGAAHVEGAMSADQSELEIDLQLQGDETAGTLTIEGVEVELILVDGDQFLRAPADFWVSTGAPAAAAAALSDQWVAVPPGESGFEELTLAGIVDTLRNPETPIRDEVREDQVDGQDVIVVEQEDGSTLSVADDDPPYPLWLTNEGDQSGTLRFSGFGEEQDISAPEDAIDPSQLPGGS